MRQTVLLVLLSVSSAVPVAAAPCESVTSLAVATVTVSTAEVMAAGSFAQPGRGGRGGASTAFASLPAFCRVAVTLRPTPRSDIKAEIWMPAAAWNGKLHVVGNGGFAGTIAYPAMAAALAAGYQGWAENGIPPRNLVSYYERVRESTSNAAGSVRLFMVPGMGHCGGGNGATTFDLVAALDRWVTGGAAPASIPASRARDGKVDRTRPLCAYPLFAVYKGSGSIEEATNFECRASR